MKILHLGDLHIGKKVNEFSMLDDQKFVLNQAIEVVKDKNINAVFISGDVFDRSVPSVYALELFNDFLDSLNLLNISVYIISGNHDNLERLSFLSSFLKKSNIFISKNFNGEIEYIDFDDDYRIYLLPYLFPALIRKFYPDIEISNYNEAIKRILEDCNLDNSKINIILAHQFVAGVDELIFSDSEQKSVGTIDMVSYQLFEKFDYTALGHLHCPQKVGLEKIRYSGSILKYSFSEINQRKYFTVVDIQKNSLEFECINIEPLHEMREYRGYLEDFLDIDFYSKINTQDYIHFILEDEFALDAKQKLSLIYPNIMLLEFDNSFTRQLNSDFNINVAQNKDIYEHFVDFYKLQNNLELDEQKEKIVIEVLELINKEDVCAP